MFGTQAAEMAARVERLKQERDAVLLAHYYVAPEVQAVADYVGDSFALAKLAVSLPNRVLVVAGVEFMGESMKLLNPEKTVLMPDPGADCPMAHMIDKKTVDAARAEYGDDLAVVCYVNSTAEAKSLSDVCVTSSNAVSVVRAMPQHHILFVPDRNLGRYVAQQVPEKHVILNDGCCPFHAAITAQEVERLKLEHPGAPVLAHPECAERVLALADCIGSTAEIIEYAATHDAPEYIVVTMKGVASELERRCGASRRFLFVQDSECPEMAKVSLAKVASCLQDMTGEVRMADGDASERAKAALERMLAYAGR
ncbi:quinolinate synthase NadA [Collinsella tanakaei]|nr:quinolinate synthase NadA [Collinsella tanakaei]MBM6906418.1 quinolinate synthase NadA [Collinsella tanakaei]